MRDIALVVIFCLVLLRVFKEPLYGVLLWNWVSFMNPHRLAYGFAYSFPFALISAVVTIPLAFGARRKINPMSAAAIGMCVLWAWMAVTSAYAMIPDEAWIQYKKVSKIFFMAIVTGMLLVDKAAINKMIAVVVGSFGYYGVKGGIFTIITGGTQRVWGPSGSFVEGNNEVAVALLMTAPFFYYLSSQVRRRFLRLALLAGMGLTVVAAVGTQSRGALLAGCAMLFYFWFKVKNKFRIALLGGLLVGVILAMMPAAWYQRMHTIETYQQDASAMSRLKAWTVATRIAQDRLTGGGFELWSVNAYTLYSPEGFYRNSQGGAFDVHSIYFEILGEHGFPGLIAYLTIWWLVFRDTRWITAKAKGVAALQWAGDLARMTQVSLIAYATGGAFLGLAYFDLPWCLLFIVGAVKTAVGKEIVASAAGVGVDAASGHPATQAGFVRTRQGGA